MPNFVTIEKASVQSADATNDLKMSIAEFSKEEAEEFADLMREGFIKHWEEKTKEEK